MKTKKIEKKLSLNKTTITMVAGDQLNNVNGGGTWDTCAQSLCYPTCLVVFNSCGETDYKKCTIYCTPSDYCAPSKPSDCYPYC